MSVLAFQLVLASLNVFGCLDTGMKLPLRFLNGHVEKQLPGISSRHCRCVSMPYVIFVRVTVVGNSTNNHAREINKSPSCFHLETEYVMLPC